MSNSPIFHYFPRRRGYKSLCSAAHVKTYNAKDDKRLPKSGAFISRLFKSEESGDKVLAVLDGFFHVAE